MSIKKTTTDYPFIRKWCSLMGSYDYYTQMQIIKAREDKAPENAVFYDDREKRWNTTDDIKNPSIRSEWGLDN